MFDVLAHKRRSGEANPVCDHDAMARLSAAEIKELIIRMEDGPYERLDSVMVARQMSNREVAGLSFIHESQISRGLNEHTGLGSHWPRIALGLNLSLNWLLFAKGPMLLSVAITDPATRSATEQTARELQRKLDELTVHHADLGKELEALITEAGGPGAAPSSIPDPPPATTREPPDDDDPPAAGSTPRPASRPPPRRERRR